MEPEPPIITVTMLAPLFLRFEAWAASQGFLVATIPGGDFNAYIVVPREVPDGPR